MNRVNGQQTSVYKIVWLWLKVTIADTRLRISDSAVIRITVYTIPV